MTDRAEDSRTKYQVMGVIIGATVVINLAFYFLSNRYYAEREAMHGAVSAAQLMKVRGAFAMFTGVTMFGALAAMFSPRLVGHAIAGIASIVALIAGVQALRADLYPVLGVALLSVGVLLPLLVRSSLTGSRAGWSFLAATCCVLALVTLFGATKIRTAVGIGLWHSMIIPGMFLVATAALAMIRHRYRDA